MSNSRYIVVPQDYDDYEDFDEVDVESRLSFDEEPSIVSITVSRKIKPDGTIVRVKETFLSDGTSYQEETAVPRRKPAAGGAGRIAASTNHNTNGKQQSRHRPYKTYKQSRKHSMEILPTHFMPDKPAPFVLNHTMSLPQSQDPKSRMMYYVCCRCTLILLSLLLVGALSIWFLLGDDTSSFLETLQSFLHNFLR